MFINTPLPLWLWTDWMDSLAYFVHVLDLVAEFLAPLDPFQEGVANVLERWNAGANGQ